MTADTRRTIGNVVLFVAVVALVVQVCGMMGWIPKFLPSREMAPIVLVLAFLSLVLRRRGVSRGADRT